MKKYAHYIATAKLKFVLISGDMQGREFIKKVMVTGKVEAKKVAKAENAIQWNF